MIVSAESLCAGYGKHQILNNVNFDADNEITVIVGANGSGKSTLLKSIFGLSDVYSGTIKVNDVDVTNCLTHELIDLGVSYMPQRENVFAQLSVIDNLKIADYSENFDFVFNIFPTLEQNKKLKVNQLSGGQQQILATAMTIVKQPPILLFDEPTANLSPKNTSLVFTKIKQIQNELKNCTIIVEQNIKESLKLCDKCYLLANGSVQYSGDSYGLLSDVDLSQKFLGIL